MTFRLMSAVETMPHLTAMSTLAPALLGHGAKCGLENAQLARAGEYEQDHVGHVPGRHHSRQHARRPPVDVGEREIGSDTAGTHARAANAVLAQLVVQRTRQADLAELRRTVDGLAGEPAAARLG